MDARTALQTLLDHVDYTKGACAAGEMVAAVLPLVVIENARKALERPADLRRVDVTLEYVDIADFENAKTSLMTILLFLERQPGAEYLKTLLHILDAAYIEKSKYSDGGDDARQ